MREGDTGLVEALQQRPRRLDVGDRRRVEGGHGIEKARGDLRGQEGPAYFVCLGIGVGSFVEAGKGTVWVNAGANQLHLSEGKEAAQVVDGKVRLHVFSEEKVGGWVVCWVVGW